IEWAATPLHRWLGRRKRKLRRRPKARPATVPLTFEALESRLVPSTVKMSAATVSAGEGDGTVAVVVEINQAPAQNETIHYATSDGTALDGSDYTGDSNTLTFTPTGGLTQTIYISLTDDSLDENSENFTVTLSNPSSGFTLGSPSTTTVTITDNDPTP